MIHTNRLPSKKERWIDCHQIPIDGTLAHKLPQMDLFKAMQKLGIPGIAPTMGHQDLSLILGDWIASEKERSA
jgi:hypothetical protein